MPNAPLRLAAVLLAAAGLPAQDSRPARELRPLATQAARAHKQLLVRIAPSGDTDTAELDATLAAYPSIAKAFAEAFLVESFTPLEPEAAELQKALKRPHRGAWPALALVDRHGELLAIVDPATWKTAGKWDPARLAQFVEFWKPTPQPDRVAQCKAKYGPIYDTEADPIATIDAAVARAKAEKKHVLVMLGGNWCHWCYLLHDELETRKELKALVEPSYVLIHVNWERELPSDRIAARLDDPARFGFPVLVVLDGDGKRLHTQDSALLETGDRHDPSRVTRFLQKWSPAALQQEKPR